MNRMLWLGMAFCMMLATALPTHAQKNRQHESFEKWRQSLHKDFNDFRQKIHEEYVDFVRNAWKEFEQDAPLPLPKEKPVPPVVAPTPTDPKPIESKPLPIEEVVKPIIKEQPQPKPVVPIEEVPVEEEKFLDFTFFGTAARVRFDEQKKFTLRGIDSNSVADALKEMGTPDYDNLIIDCLNLRSEHKLNDWAYLQMLKSLGETLYGKATNEAELLMAYVYLQSGYKMRLANDGATLYMLYSSQHRIYNQTSYKLDGEYFYGLKQLPERLLICEAVFPKEKSMSLYIRSAMQLTENLSETRNICSKRYKEMAVNVQTNKNLMDFYETYPSSVIGENFCTRWAMYANTPLQTSLTAQLYPKLRSLLAGKTKKEAVEMLLNWVQTGFEYQFDDEVWGHDRAFFAEETLYYPYCDCEDRSILFTRLVRDLLALPCILVYYPGHLAAAVGFGEEVAGDYIALNGKRFTIADPTYIGASVGMTMPKMDNSAATVILLD